MTHEEQVDNRKKLVVALRSGNYEQAKYRLHDGKGYCCLGVACLVAGKTFEPVGVNYYVKGTKESKLLPYDVRDYFGFRSADGSMRDSRILSVLNDRGMPFSEIADIIEAEPPGLFNKGSHRCR